MGDEEIEKILNNKNDFYRILNVDKFANSEEIKKQYKKLVFIYHPDKNKNIKAEEAFKIINNAYLILINEDKRKEYDIKLNKKNNKCNKEKEKKKKFNISKNYNKKKENKYYYYNNTEYKKENTFNFNLKQNYYFSHLKNSNELNHKYYQKKDKFNYFNDKQKNDSSNKNNYNNNVKIIFDKILFIIILILIPIFFEFYKNINNIPNIRFKKSKLFKYIKYTKINNIEFYVKDQNFDSHYNITKISKNIEYRYLKYLYINCNEQKFYSKNLKNKKAYYNELLKYKKSNCNEMKIKSYLNSINENLKKIDLSYCIKYDLFKIKYIK